MSAFDPKRTFGREQFYLSVVCYFAFAAGPQSVTLCQFHEGCRMSRLHPHPEHHLVDRIGWLRAAVLGANDGIVSTASLIVGVATAATTQNEVLIAGVAGLVAGSMSMAAGEYVSVSSQSDTEQADLAREHKELSDNVEFERKSSLKSTLSEDSNRLLHVKLLDS